MHESRPPLFDPTVQRERLFAQDPRLVEAAARLATSIKALPPDPKYPDLEPRALLIGGFVRDALLGAHPKDLDVEVYGVSPERLMELLEQLYPGRVNTVGQAFGILKINLGEDVEFDISIPRRESKSGKGHTGFLVEGDPRMTVQEAARRRDFTINSIAADPLTGEVLDAFDGLKDLEERHLRVTDPERFQDDPLRVYRAVQFAARLGFAVEPKSFDLMREMVARGDLNELSKERITDEIKKLLLKAEKPSVGFELMRELGIIKKDYPELDVLIGTPQEPEWHPEGDVWIHTMMVVDVAANLIRQPERNFNADEKRQVVLGALCHDLGKPSTTAIGKKDGVARIRSLGHEEAGAAPTERLLARWSFGEDVERAAVTIAKEHLKPSMLRLQMEKGALDEAAYANAVRKLLKRIHPISWRVLVAASEADSRGRTLPGADTEPYASGDLFAATIIKNKLDEAPTKPLLKGEDLMERGFKPGVELGKMIRRIENIRDEGKIRTREEALVLLDHILGEQKK